MRAPRSVRLEDMRQAAANGAALPTPFAAPEGVSVYVSSFPGYLVEVVNIPSYIDQGRRVPGKRIAAQFRDGIYRNDHRDPATRKLIDEALQQNPYFGKFGGGPQVHFWLAADQQAVVEAARVKSALTTLQSLPKDVIAKYAAELAQGDADDHIIPDAAADAKPAGTRPIPPTAAQ
jgi:hypothetical protein